MSKKREPITIRLDPEIRERMEAARAAAPFRPSVTAVVERGIVLATEELERQARAWVTKP